MVKCRGRARHAHDAAKWQDIQKSKIKNIKHSGRSGPMVKCRGMAHHAPTVYMMSQLHLMKNLLHEIKTPPRNAS